MTLRATLPAGALVAVWLLLAACGGTGPVTSGPVGTVLAGGAPCPVVLDAEFVETAVGVYTVNVTVRSVDVEGVSFADAWEVRSPDGEVLGTRVLAHPHATEQPFTRSLGNVSIPPDLTEVLVEARDSVSGFCGVPLTVEVPRS